MSTRPIADCEACLDALTELVCDELDAETRAAVLRHTKTCESCARQLSQFRGVMSVAEAMPLEEPSPRVRQTVLVAAREAQARKAVEARAGRQPSDSPWVRFAAWLEQLGTWAMSPQVAMVSVLLLMLGVGLVALPIGREPEHAALRPAEEASRPAQPAATAAAAPVQIEESAEAPATLEPATAQGAEAMGGATPEKAMRREFSDEPLARSRAQRSPGPGGRGVSKGELSKDEAYRSSDDGLGSLSAAGTGTGRNAGSERAFPSSPDQPAKVPVPKPADSSVREKFASPPPPYASAQAEADAVSESEKLADKKAEASPEAALLAQGVRAAQAGDARGAIAVLRPLAEKGAPSVRQTAGLWLARSYRATGDCTNALRYYAPLAASKNAAPGLLSEAADCYERTGDMKQASALRSRAEPVRAVEGKASAKPATATPAAEPSRKE